MSQNRYLQELYALGQSIWYDNLSRDVLRSGTLKAFIDAGVTGLTSNPTIFKKAIADSEDYNETISGLIKDAPDMDPHDLCEKLMIEDVGAAADLLLPIYQSTNANDGYASIEVSPKLAHDTKGTVEAAKKLWSTLNRPNIMIKIPATKEGYQAITEVLAEGINVNVTLIFSPTAYQEVINAYCAGLEQRAAQGQSIESIRSVASFFISRVDALCEKELAKRVEEGALSQNQIDPFIGKVGIANSKIAYHLYEQTRDGQRYKALQQQEASLQRPLWASTGTKNPNFSKVLYVEELAGKDTVNTLPPDTLEALMSGATIEPRLHHGYTESEELITQLSDTGIHLEELLDTLLQEGIASFEKSYDELIEAVVKKSKILQ